MKRKLSLIAAGLVLASAAQADPASYLSVGIGRSQWNEDCTGIAQCDKTGTAVRIVGGHEFVKRSFAIEGLYLDLGKIRAADSGVSVELKAYAVGVGAAVIADFAPDWRGTARLGVASVQAKGTGSGLGISASESNASAQAYYGLGLSYAVTPAMYIEASLDGTRIKLLDQTENVSSLTLGLGWRF